MSNQPSTKAKSKRTLWLTWLSPIAVVLIIYFVNVEVQTYLGKQALAQSGLPMLDLDTAITQAKTENKLILADMSAIWCPTCRRLDNDIFANLSVQAALSERFVVARVEYESPQGEAFMAKYNVKGFPTLLILAANGSLIKQLPITFNPENFIENLTLQ